MARPFVLQAAVPPRPADDADAGAEPKQHRREPYIVEGAGHGNVVDHDVETYFSRMEGFLQSCELRAASCELRPATCSSY